MELIIPEICPHCKQRMQWISIDYKLAKFLYFRLFGYAWTI